MASFFGEVIEPSSRAIFDEFSDDEETTDDLKLQLSWTSADEKLPSVFDVIFVIHGRLSLVFAESYLLNNDSKPSAEIHIIPNTGNVDKDDDSYQTKILPSTIFISKNKAICLVSPSCPPELGYEFTETIAPLLKISEKVILITNESIYNYKASSLSELPAAFVRELKTTHNKSKDLAEKLSTPNFISGIPAAVISWCQMHKKDGSALICFSDQQKLDSITASPYLSVIKKSGFDVIKNENPNLNKKSFYGKPGVIGEYSNIYI